LSQWFTLGTGPLRGSLGAVIGLETRRLDPEDSEGFIGVAGVAADADGTDDPAAPVANENSPGFGTTLPPDATASAIMKLGFCWAFSQRVRLGSPMATASPRFAQCDFRPEEARIVFALQSLEMPALIENRDAIGRPPEVRLFSIALSAIAFAWSRVSCAMRSADQFHPYQIRSRVWRRLKRDSLRPVGPGARPLTLSKTE
jgi:hypothetical protein